MRIAFIGSGNVATHLAKAFEKAGHVITEIYSRTPAHAVKLSQKLYEATVLKSLDFRQAKAEILFICVTDDAISEVVNQIKLRQDQIVIHTSGATTLQVFNKIPAAHAVFYPVQTFTKNKLVDFKAIPICIEASDVKTEKIVEKLAHTICEHVAILDSSDRQILHIAAVFACNFTNHLLALSNQYLTEQGIPFEILHPLIRETFEKALTQNPALNQTGPAIRKDKKTIQNHLKLLKHNSRMHTIYEILTESIQLKH